MNGKLTVFLIVTLAVAIASAIPSKKKADDKIKINARKTEDVPKGKNDKNAKVESKKKEEDKDEEEEDEIEDDDEGEDEDDDDDEDNKHMAQCLEQENVTESEMKDFLILKTVMSAREPLKKAILCFLKKIEFFDGNNWNVENIAESLGEETAMFKMIKTCIKKDDRKLEAHERSYRVQKCVLESEANNRRFQKTAPANH